MAKLASPLKPTVCWVSIPVAELDSPPIFPVCWLSNSVAELASPLNPPVCWLSLPCGRTFFSFQPSSLQTLHLCGRTCFSSQSSRLLTLHTRARTSPYPTVWWLTVPVAAFTCPPIYHILIISLILFSLVWWWIFLSFQRTWTLLCFPTHLSFLCIPPLKVLYPCNYFHMYKFFYVLLSIFLWSHSVSYVLAPAIF